jgi:flagellar protein FlgJ
MLSNVTNVASPVGTTTEDAVYRARVQHAAEQFESFFIAQMLRQMRSATRAIAGDESVFGSSTHTDMLDLADTAFADAMAQQRAFGIADVIARQLLPDAKSKPGT